MDFQEIWGKPTGAPEPMPDRKELAEMLGKESLGLLSKLRRQLRIKMYWGIGILVFFPFMALLAKDTAVMVLSVGVMVFMSVLLLVGVFVHYRKLPDHLDMSQGMLPLLKAYHALVRRALRFEERVGAMFVIPAPAFGALLGLSYGSGKPLGVLLSNPFVIGVLLLLMAIIGPLGVWMTIWMNRITFGKYLDKLQSNIKALEEM